MEVYNSQPLTVMVSHCLPVGEGDWYSWNRFNVCGRQSRTRPNHQPSIRARSFTDWAVVCSKRPDKRTLRRICIVDYCNELMMDPSSFLHADVKCNGRNPAVGPAFPASQTIQSLRAIHLKATPCFIFSPIVDPSAGRDKFCSATCPHTFSARFERTPCTMRRV
jgi:hypothetical protein